VIMYFKTQSNQFCCEFKTSCWILNRSIVKTAPLLIPTPRGIAGTYPTGSGIAGL